MQGLLRAALLVAIASSLGGCAAPGVLTLMSLSANGVSYAVSGKSVSDHALSMVLERDCALWRVLYGGQVCAPETDISEMLATGPTAAQASLPSNSPDPMSPAPATSPRRRQSLALASPAATPLEAARDPFPTAPAAPGAAASAASPSPASLRLAEPAPKGELRHPDPLQPDQELLFFAVIGSFADRANAEALAATALAHQPLILASETSAGVRYRVVATAAERSVLTREELTAAGHPGSWTIQLCADTLGPPPCTSPTMVAQRG